MDIEYQDIIKLDDKKEYVIASKVNYQNNDYIYLVDINNNKNIKICEIEENNSISVLDNNYDKKLIETLIPLFYNNSKNDIFD